MRLITVVTLVLALVLPAAAQKAPTVGSSADPAALLLRELAKYEYKAKRNVPAADCIFVEKGKIQEGMYKLAMETGGVLLKAGVTTKVSSVKIMDRGVQIFFETDKCAMINMAADTEDPAKMSMPKLVEFSKESIAALFEIVGSNKAGGTEPGAAAPEPREKPTAKEEKKPS